MRIFVGLLFPNVSLIFFLFTAIDYPMFPIVDDGARHACFWFNFCDSGKRITWPLLARIHGQLL